MKHLFIPYELALAYKESGFDDVTIAYYDVDKYPIIYTGYGDCKNSNFIPAEKTNNPKISAPLYQEVIDWLRKAHKIQLFADYTYYDGFHYGYKWVKGDGSYGEWWKDNDGETADGFDTPEEALNNAIKEALNLIK